MARAGTCIVDFGSARGATVSVVCCEAEQGFGLKKAVGVLQIHNCGCLGGPEVAVCTLISILGCNLVIFNVPPRGLAHRGYCNQATPHDFSR